MNKEFYQPDKDAGLGLIFRLNDLWVKADRKALAGDYDEWELVLDRIFSNLMYRKEPDIEEDKDGQLTNIDFKEPKMKEWRFIKKQIGVAKSSARIASRKDYSTKQAEHYLSVMNYDIWLRKFMQSLGGLYLKESESNPSRALFGNAFGKK